MENRDSSHLVPDQVALSNSNTKWAKLVLATNLGLYIYN